MKKLLIILLIPFLFCSCRESEQINEIAFVKIIAIDKAEDGMLVTAGIQLPKSKEGKTVEGKDYISVNCRTLSQGLNLLEEATDKKMFFGQIGCVLIGEDMAREGIINTVDYLVRSDELRFDIPVIVVRDNEAKKLIQDNSGNEHHISDRINKMLESNYSTSSSGQVELSQLVEMLEDPFRSPYLPYITIGDENFTIDGYCIFKKDKMRAFLNEEESLGINVLNNDVENWVYIAQVDGKSVTLKVTDFKSSIKMKEGIFNIRIDFMTEVLQSDSSIEKFDHELSQKLIECQEKEILRITDEAIKTLKDYGCDTATFGDTFHNTSPKIAEEYVDKWDETFSRITYTVNITSKMDPSKTSGKPVKQGGK